MISVGEARAIMLEHVAPLGQEDVALCDALGRTLAQPIVARRAQPPFRASAMDGYAVRASDTPGVLRVVGEAGAGHAFDHALQRGECARIFTGAPVPAGADAVLIQENAPRDGDAITAPLVEVNQHVRPAGVDFAEGAVLLSASAELSGPAIALAAAAGHAELSVMRQPRIAVMGGGDEIVAPGTEAEASQVYDSASYGVAALAATWGARATTAAPYRDTAEEMAVAFDTALAGADLAVVIGAASVGDHDHARAAIKAIGAELLFEKVALRPGKPTWFAVRHGKTILGLPGNPASALVCARLFLRPLVAQLLGLDPNHTLTPCAARLRQPLASNGARETYLRGKTSRDETGQFWVEVAENQDSSLISVFARSNVLVVRAPDAEPVSAGHLVQTLPI